MESEKIRKEHEWICYKCKFYNKWKFQCIHPDYNTDLPDFGVGYNYETQTCTTFTQRKKDEPLTIKISRFTKNLKWIFVGYVIGMSVATIIWMWLLLQYR